MLLCWAMLRPLLWFGFHRPPQEPGSHEGCGDAPRGWGSPGYPARRCSPAEGQEQGHAAGARLVPIISIGGKYRNIAMKE